MVCASPGRHRPTRPFLRVRFWAAAAPDGCNPHPAAAAQPQAIACQPPPPIRPTIMISRFAPRTPLPTPAISLGILQGSPGLALRTTHALALPGHEPRHPPAVPRTPQPMLQIGPSMLRTRLTFATAPPRSVPLPATHPRRPSPPGRWAPARTPAAPPPARTPWRRGRQATRRAPAPAQPGGRKR